MQIVGVIGLLLIAYGTPVSAEWHQYQQDIMGTRIAVELFHQDSAIASDCANRVFEDMHRIDRLMSPYKPDSELSRINRQADQQPVAISAELHRVLHKALAFSELSGGAFDISFASIGFHYDYRQQQKPGAETISQLLDRIDYRQIQLSNNSIRFKKTGMKIDLGGIAKGYAVDQAIEILTQCGITRALVSAGGDSRILGDRHGRDWVIGIQHPRKKQEVVLRIPLSNTSISTSGDYERFYIEGNERVHHIINPKTGQSAKQSWSATVIGENTMATDALSTTLFVLGAERGLQLINSLEGMDAVIIDTNAVIHYSAGLQNPHNPDNNKISTDIRNNGNP